MMPDKENFIRIIEMTPLVSIDLIIHNKQGEVLLGYRLNRPAQHFWFVPGGRIRKNEPLKDALKRISHNEVGIHPGHGRLIGAFDHFYNDNYFDLPGLSTHYVALAYIFEITGDARLLKDYQHEELKWWAVDDLLASSQVHENTKLYFRKSEPDSSDKAHTANIG